MMDLTNYYFGVEHGFKANLATDPIFGENKHGERYARVVVYCKSQENNRHIDEISQSVNAPSLITYIKIYDSRLFAMIKTLRKGDFVNFQFDSITFGVSDNGKKDEFSVIAFARVSNFKLLSSAKIKQPVNKTHLQNFSFRRSAN